MNPTWSSNPSCTESYSNSPQNSIIFAIMILIWFPGDSGQFYCIKRKINISKSISKRHIKSYGLKKGTTTFELVCIMLLFFCDRQTKQPSNFFSLWIDTGVVCDPDIIDNEILFIIGDIGHIRWYYHSLLLLFHN